MRCALDVHPSRPRHFGKDERRDHREFIDTNDLANVSWLDVRLHQVFSLVAFAYIISTWIASPTVTLALAVLLYVVTIPLLVCLYVVTRESGSQLPIPAGVVCAVLLGASLSWAVSSFVLEDSFLAEVAPLVFLIIASGVIAWNVLQK